MLLILILTFRLPGQSTLSPTPAQEGVESVLDLYIPTVLHITQKEWLEIKFNFTRPLNANWHCKPNSCTYPGTKWCGPGNEASSYDDLGPLDPETDKCCRTHDHCSISVDPGQTNCSFHNTDHFTRSGCDCDLGLISCLSERNTYTSLIIGYLFSTFMRECLVFDQATQKCILRDEDHRVFFFASRLIQDMVKEKEYFDKLVHALGNAFNVYKCYRNTPYSGDIYVDQCKISCQISNPFSTDTEFYSPYDCNLMNTICCDPVLQDTDLCRVLTPSIGLVPVHCKTYVSNYSHYFILVKLIGLLYGA